MCYVYISFYFAVQVKEVVPCGVAARHGGIKKGDCILSVNGHSLVDKSMAEALEILREAGDHVTLVISRVIDKRTTKTPSSPLGPSAANKGESPDMVGVSRPLPNARNYAKHTQGASQGTPSQHSEYKPTSMDYSKVESWRMSLQWSPQNIYSGETSEPRSTMLTPKQKRKKYASRDPQGKVLTFTDPQSTLPRKISGNKVGVYLVELNKGRHEGWVGLQLAGSEVAYSGTPVIVKAVLRGSSAYRSGKIHVGDKVIEVNGVSFEDMSVREAVAFMRNLPEGKVSMIMRGSKSRGVKFSRKRLF